MRWDGLNAEDSAGALFGTSAGFKAWLISIWRAVASRPRCSSTSRSICVTLICSGVWRRPV